MPGDGNKTNPVLAFLLGAAIVVAVGLGVLAYTGNLPFGEDEPSITIELPDVDSGS